MRESREHAQKGNLKGGVWGVHLESLAKFDFCVWGGSLSHANGAGHGEANSTSAQGFQFGGVNAPPAHLQIMPVPGMEGKGKITGTGCSPSKEQSMQMLRVFCPWGKKSILIHFHLEYTLNKLWGFVSGPLFISGGWERDKCFSFRLLLAIMEKSLVFAKFPFPTSAPHLTRALPPSQLSHSLSLF